MATKQSQGTDVFEILRNDHQNVSRIINDLKKAGQQQKQQLFNQLQDELNEHMTLEERYFYSRLEDIEDVSDLIQDSLADHDDIRQILQQMSEEDVGSEEWETNCQALEDTKDDHVDLEEQELFPQVVELVEASELIQIAEQITAEKSRVERAPAARREQKRPPRAEI